MARENFEAFTEEYYTQYNNTITSGETRIPICFCIDISESMSFVTNKSEDLIYEDSPAYSLDGSDNVRTVKPKPGIKIHHRIDELKRVLQDMLYRMNRIPILRNSAVVCIVTFSRFADCVIEFSELQNISWRTIESITTAADSTDAAKGIQMSLERLDAMTRIIKNAGNESYKPVFIFMSDGNPTDGNEAERAGYEVRERSERGELNVIPIGIGSIYETERWLKQLSKENRIYHMEHEEEFDEVFARISSKINRTASVISVDESLVDNENDNTDDDKTASSKYGATISSDEMKDFLRNLGNI